MDGLGNNASLGAILAVMIEQSAPRSEHGAALLLLVPAAFAVLGLLVRYLAYANTVEDASVANFADGLCRWDCGWYVRLSEEGYDPFPVPSMINAGNWAFFPLYPMLIAALRMLTGLPTMVVATAASIALSIAASRAAWPLLGKDMRAYTLFSAFLLAGPFAIYFTTFYTEVLFLTLTICVFAALQRRAYLAAGAFAALVSGTRIVGVFIVLAIVLQAWLDHRERGGSLTGFVPAVLKRTDLLVAIFIAPLGLFAYMAYLHWHIGDALAFSHVQRAWGRATGNPLVYLWNALTNFPRDSWWPTVSQQLGAAWIVGMAMTVVMAIRRQFAAALFCFVCLILPLSAGLASMLRFVVGLAPVTITAMTLLSRSRVVHAIALGVILLGGYFGTVGWLTGVLTLV